MQGNGLRPYAPGELSGIALTLLDAPRVLQAGVSARIRICVSNNTNLTVGDYRWWTPHPLLLGYLWQEHGAPAPVMQDRLTEIWRAVAPGESRITNLRIQTPQKPGNYALWVCLVQRGVRWYDSNTEVRPLQVGVAIAAEPPQDVQAINRYEESIYSQNGEDGILRELFLRLGIAKGFAVEFGVGDGMECNAAYWLRDYGWGGLLIEGSPADFARIVQNYRDRGRKSSQRVR